MHRYERRYLPGDFDPGDPEGVELLWEELDARPLPDRAALEAWLRDLDELVNACLEEGQRLSLAASKDTGNALLRARLHRFLDEISHGLRAHLFSLEERLLSSPFRRELDRDRFGEYLAALEIRHRLHRTENHRVVAEANRVASAYEQLRSGTIVRFERDPMPLALVELFENAPERPRRASAWRARWERLGRDAGRYEDLYDETVRLHDRLARNAGCRDYVEYTSLHLRRPYGVAVRRGLHRAVARHAVPLLREMQRRRRERLGVSRLRPWDESVDPEGRGRLCPFNTPAELVHLVERAVERVDPEFARRLGWMAEHRLLDLETRPEKERGDFTCTLHESRLPFIFMNAGRSQRAVETLLHEGGHAFRAFETRHLEPRFNRAAPFEFSEMAARALELMALEGLDEMYAPADARRARREQLERLVKRLCWVCALDAFELEVFPRPLPAREQRALSWLEIFREFRGDICYRGLERAERHRWYVQEELFKEPLHLVEQAVALVGALQLWRAFRADPEATVRAYRRALRLGGTRSLPRLFEVAGVRLDLGDAMVGELMEMVEEIWAGVSRRC